MAKSHIESTIYILYKREHPGYEFEEYGRYDLSTTEGFKKMVKAIFDFGRWMYDSGKLVPADPNSKAEEVQFDL